MVQKKSLLTTEEKKKRAKFSRIFRVYGITKDQYDAIDIGKCVVCERNWGGTVIPCIDHNHKTGEIRGLLCRYCNRYRVGHFTDSAMVYRIYEYLQHGNTGWIVPPRKKKRRKKKKIE